MLMSAGLDLPRQVFGHGFMTVDGQRMSKSRGNVIDPDEQVSTYGADVVRAFLMFGYQWSEGGLWNTDNIQGVVRWINRVWAILQPEMDDKRTTHHAGHTSEAGSQMSESVAGLRRVMHQSIKKV